MFQNSRRSNISNRASRTSPTRFVRRHLFGTLYMRRNNIDVIIINEFPGQNTFRRLRWSPFVRSARSTSRSRGVSILHTLSHLLKKHFQVWHYYVREKVHTQHTVRVIKAVFLLLGHSLATTGVSISNICTNSHQHPDQEVCNTLNYGAPYVQ